MNFSREPGVIFCQPQQHQRVGRLFCYAKSNFFKGRFKEGFGVHSLYFAFRNNYLQNMLERAAGIEPASSAWKACDQNSINSINSYT